MIAQHTTQVNNIPVESMAHWSHELIDDESEGLFENNCQTFITRMRHCSSQEEYNTVLHEYEGFVTEYSRAHPGFHYPSAPAYQGATVTTTEVVGHEPHVVASTGCMH